MDPQAWKSLRPGQRPKPVPKMSFEKIRAGYARREAEQQAQRLRQQAELERARLEYEADIEPAPAPSETSIESFVDTEF